MLPGDAGSGLGEGRACRLGGYKKAGRRIKGPAVSTGCRARGARQSLPQPLKAVKAFIKVLEKSL